MKSYKFNVGITGCFLILALSGCDKSTTSIADTIPTTTSVKTEEVKKTKEIKNGADASVTTLQQTSEKTVTDFKQSGDAMANSFKSQLKATDPNGVTAVLAKAQTQISDKKYQEALATLLTLKDAKLTDSQQKMVDAMKAQIHTWMNSDAGKAATK